MTNSQRYPPCSICQIASDPAYKGPPLLGIVPWAPLPEGLAAVEEYLGKLYATPSLLNIKTPASHQDPTESSTPSPIKGVRFLLEFAPPKACLTPDFILALKHLVTKGLIFEYTVDSINVPDALDHVLESIEGVHSQLDSDPVLLDDSKPVQINFVLDHMGKPNIKADTSSLKTILQEYTDRIFALSLQNDLAIKLSGMLSFIETSLLQKAFEEFVTKGQGANDPGSTASSYQEVKRLVNFNAVFRI